MDVTQIAYSLVLDFLRKAMGCFSCCFRIRDEHRPQINRFSPPIVAIPKEQVDRLTSSSVWPLLAPEEYSDGDRDPSQCEDGSAALDDELRAEAQFLKACGTLPQTPIEIRKTGKLYDSQPLHGDTEFTSNSRLPDTAPEEALQQQVDQSRSPMNFIQKLENESRLPDAATDEALQQQLDLPQSPINFIRKSESESRLPDAATEEALQQQLEQLQSPINLIQKLENESDVSPVLLNRLEYTDSILRNSNEGSAIGPAASTQYKKKSVHFESQCDSFSSSSANSNPSPKVNKVPLKLQESPFDHTIQKPSPYPTPLKLTDDMQTPGTVFPSYGKNPKIRVQYATSAINRRNFSQLDSPIEEESIVQADPESPRSEEYLQECTTSKESSVCPTLSSWLPPKSNHEEDRVDQRLVGQTPGDRPILGVVNWNADDTSLTPKWVDANGIPNTTNKYSEDQKVRWHSTPFEDRLEKALKEDKFIFKMKNSGGTTSAEF